MIKMEFTFINDQYAPGDPSAGVSKMAAEIHAEDYQSFLSTMVYYLNELRPPMIHNPTKKSR